MRVVSSGNGLVVVVEPGEDHKWHSEYAAWWAHYDLVPGRYEASLQRIHGREVVNASVRGVCTQAGEQQGPHKRVVGQEYDVRVWLERPKVIWQVGTELGLGKIRRLNGQINELEERLRMLRREVGELERQVQEVGA